MLFRVRGGRHVEAGTTYHKGDIVESDRDLAKVFVNKFDRVYQEQLEEEKAAKEMVVAVEELPKPKPRKAAEPVKTTKGEDVTEDFKRAQEEDFKVYKRGSWYHVYEDSNDVKSLNEKGLRKAQVSPFIKKYMEE